MDIKDYRKDLKARFLEKKKKRKKITVILYGRLHET